MKFDDIMRHNLNRFERDIVESMHDNGIDLDGRVAFVTFQKLAGARAERDGAVTANATLTEELEAANRVCEAVQKVDTYIHFRDLAETGDFGGMPDDPQDMLAAILALADSLRALDDYRQEIKEANQ